MYLAPWTVETLALAIGILSSSSVFMRLGAAHRAGAASHTRGPHAGDLAEPAPTQRSLAPADRQVRLRAPSTR